MANIINFDSVVFFQDTDASGTISYIKDGTTYTIQGNDWPIQLDYNGIEVSFSSDVILNNSNQYFEFIKNGLFDGTNKKFDIDGVTNWSGLVDCSEPGLTTTVKNINLELNGSEIIANSGGIVKNNAGQINSNCTIENCSLIGDIIGNNSGGIAGIFAGFFGICSINNCYSIGNISGNEAGGICGKSAGYSGNCSITNCYLIGDISGNEAGGICGKSAATFIGNCNITNCYSIGIISGNEAGGICGKSAAAFNGNCNITNCYSIGIISGNDAGGIVGTRVCEQRGTFTIKNCYSSGIISGNNAGGICGSNIGFDIVFGTGKLSILNCYTSGDISNNTEGISYTLYDVQSVNPNITITENNSTTNDGNNIIRGWNDISANMFLGDSTGTQVWKKVTPIEIEEPWKLLSFLDTTITIENEYTKITYKNNNNEILSQTNIDRNEETFKIKLLYGNQELSLQNINFEDKEVIFNLLYNLNYDNNNSFYILVELNDGNEYVDKFSLGSNIILCKCPLAAIPNNPLGINFGGTENRPGFLMTKSFLYSTNVRNPQGKKLFFSNIKLNAFGKYSGAIGGSGQRPRNKF